MDQHLLQAIEQLKQGKQQGFQILYDKTHNYVYLQARNFLKNETDANDLVQEVYINAYRSITSLQDNHKIYSWLSGITFRQATKLMRKQKEIILQEDDIFENIIDFDEDFQPESALDKKTSAHILMELIEELPALQKAALIAHYYDDLSIAEISDIFSCSQGTIKSRLNYARKNLKESIRKKEEKDGIRLYSFSLPLLLLSLRLYADFNVMNVVSAGQILENCLLELNIPILQGCISADRVSTLTEHHVTNTLAKETLPNGLYTAGKYISIKGLTTITISLTLISGIIGGIIGNTIAQTEQETLPTVINTEISSAEILSTTEFITEKQTTEAQTTKVQTTEVQTTEVQTTEAQTTEIQTTEAPITEDQITKKPNNPSSTSVPSTKPDEDEFILDAPEIDIE